jgi:DNA-binding IclR family transcriptional regulator
VTKSLAPGISAATLANLIGSPASNVTFYLNRFRDLGLIDFNGRIRVHRALLNTVLHDRLPGDNAAKPALPDFSLRTGSQPTPRTGCANPSSRARSSAGRE